MNDNSSAILALSLDRLPFRKHALDGGRASAKNYTAANAHVLPEYEWVAI